MCIMLTKGRKGTKIRAELSSLRSTQVAKQKKYIIDQP